jgi:glycosyltransferase involved in cell wall biosynthesis
VSRRFGQIDIYAPLHTPGSADYQANLEFELDPSWASITTLPFGGGSVVGEVSRQRELFSIYSRAFRHNDWVVFFQPAGYRLAGILTCIAQRRPYTLYFACEWAENAPFTYRFGAPSGPGYWAYLKSGELGQRLALSRARFNLTAGEALRASVSRSGVPTYTTSPRMNLSLDDISPREDTCQGDQITCLFAGALVPRKGLVHLLRAIATLRGQGLPVVLRAAGEGPQRPELEKLIDELGLGDAVELLGHVRNGAALWDLYRDADIFTLPTLAEGFPRVLYEAMSQCLPIVTTRVSGIPYTVRDRENGLVVEPEDADGLVAAIAELARDAELRRKLIANALKTVRPILETDPGDQLVELIERHGGVTVG